nr:hypothetical protein [Methanobrevibacter arboriphilus]
MNVKNKETLFNIYYLNVSKVYELSMMIDNIIVSKIEKETEEKDEKNSKDSLSISIGNSQNYLAETKAIMGNEKIETHSSSSRIKELLDVKTTKSILLRSIIEKCENIKDFKDCNEGSLIKMDNIELKVLDEENTRGFKVLKRNMLEGMKFEGLEINNMLNAMLEDVSYVLYSKIEEDGENIAIKIPMTFDKEFENDYSLSDLLIGNVSIIGIYKGKIDRKTLASNTPNYFAELGSNSNNTQNSEILDSSYDPKPSNENNIKFEKNRFEFIDIISVIQDVNFETPKIVENDSKNKNKILILLKKVKKRLKIFRD